MAKRPGKGHDATQNVSTSQLVPNERPVLHRGNAKNDMSLWGGVVVGTQDFAPPAPNRSKRTPWKWIAIGLVIIGVALSTFLIVNAAGTNKPAPTAKAVAPAPVAADAGLADAAVAQVAVRDAGAPDAPAAAPTVVAVTTEADAVSGVGAIIKPAKTTRKASPKRKKKTAKKKK